MVAGEVIAAILKGQVDNDLVIGTDGPEEGGGTGIGEEEAEGVGGREGGGAEGGGMTGEGTKGEGELRHETGNK